MIGPSTSGNMSVRNGYVQQRNQRARRRNAVANIFSEMNDGDVRALRQQAREMLHPAMTGGASAQSSSISTGTVSDTSSSGEEGQQQQQQQVLPRRRRNAVPDLREGISMASLEQLRENAILTQHPAAMSTTPPGAPGAGAEAASASASYVSYSSSTNSDEDEPGAASLLEASQESPSHTFAIDSICSAFPDESLSSRYLPESSSIHEASSGSSELSSSSADFNVTETEVDIFREEVAKASYRYQQRRNAVCAETTQALLSNIISAASRGRQQRRQSNIPVEVADISSSD